MPEVTAPRCPSRPGSGPTGNRAGVPKVREVGKEASLKNPLRVRVSKNQSPESVVRCNVSTDGSCSSDSSGSFSSVRSASFRGRRKPNGVKCGKFAPDAVEASEVSPSAPVVEKRRCGWITLSSDPLYVSFHDEEWGVPVHDDSKLFELLVLSQALGELSWSIILNKRDIFRKLFDNFDPASVAKFNEKKILSLAASSNALLSEPKLRAIVENAKQILKVQEEVGSFTNYCWRFVNHKPIVNGFRYERNVPVKTPKAEVISKDMMKRGFRCVGPTTIYSFMQAAGIVNDHLCSCFRYKECHPNVKMDCATEVEAMDKLVKSAEQVCLLQA